MANINWASYKLIFMLRKTLTTTFIIVLLAGIVISYLYLKKQKEYDGVDPFSAVPESSASIVQLESIEQFISKLNKNKGIWQEMKHFKKMEEVHNQLQLIDSFAQYAGQKPVSLNRPLSLVSHLQGKSDVEYLYILPIFNHQEKKKIKELIATSIKPDLLLHERSYQNTKIYSIPKSKKNKNEFHFAFSRALLLASKSSLLLESSIRQLSSGNSISKSKSFQKILKTTGKNVDANLFLNWETFPKQISFSLTKQHQNFLQNYTHFGNWTELDLSFRDRLILLNGFTYSDPLQGKLMSLFLQQETVKMEMPSILPASTGFFAILGMNDPFSYREAYHNFLEKAGKLTDYKKSINKLNKKAGAKLSEIIFSIIHKEIALVGSENSRNKKFTAIRTKSASIAKEKLMTVISAYAEKQKRSVSHYKHTYQLDAETSFDMYRLPEEALPEKLFGKFFKHASSTYFTFVENYMIMGPDIHSLSDFIQESVLGKTLNTNHVYKKNKEFLSEKANFFAYISTPKANSFVESFLHKDLQKDFQDHKEHFNKFQSAGLQLSANKGMIYNNLFVEYTPTPESLPQTQWESRIDTCFRHKPYLVKNHYTQENEVLVQDANHQIYLINPAGRILWKKVLDDEIVGKIEQIDCFKNNKLQYLFATKNHLHLIDRNGNDVGNYPVRLRSEAIRGISVFDYDKNKNYRIFIPCANQKVYAYTKEGKTISGWNPKKSENAISCELQHFRVDGKDYIVYADKYRVYILNRRGEERVRLKKQFSKSENNPFYLDEKQKRIVTSSADGKVYHIDFNGKVTSKSFAKLSPAHYFVLSDLNADGKNEYLFADYNLFQIFDASGKRKLEKEFESEISHSPNIYQFSRTGIEIGICIEKQNQIYLFNRHGQIHKGFPLKGNTEFSIGFAKPGNKSFNLYVGDKRNFLLNYSVH